MAAGKYALGLEFGTERVRVLVVNIFDGGRIAAQASAAYRRGVIERTLPTSAAALAPGDALQHPQDWLDALAAACREAVAHGNLEPEQIIGIGLAFAGCTVLPCRADGTPICLTGEFEATSLAWPKLWKHRAARAQAQRINEIARQRNEPWLSRCGGRIGAEWFFPKVCHMLEGAPEVYAAADLFVEAGDWLVWQLTSGPFPRCDLAALVRSTCQAGYRAQWNSRDGYPSPDFFRALDPRLEQVVAEKMPGGHRSPGGRPAGGLSAASARLLGLREATPISSAIIDAHAAVPGAGVASPSTMVLHLGGGGGGGEGGGGEGSSHLMNSRIEVLGAPGVAGVVEDGILPGYVGYEIVAPPVTRPTPLDRARIEADAFDLRRIIESMRDSGLPVRRFVACGESSRTNPLLMQIYADVLGEKITIAQSDQPAALGAAILGCLAAGEAATGHAHPSQVIHAMGRRQRADLVYRPDLKSRKAYDQLYALYRPATPSTS